MEGLKRGSKDFCRYYYEEEGDFCAARNQGCSCGGEREHCFWPRYFNCDDATLERLKTKDRLEASVASEEAYKR